MWWRWMMVESPNYILDVKQTDIQIDLDTECWTSYKDNKV